MAVGIARLGVAKNTKHRRQLLGISAIAAARSLENKVFFNLARHVHWIVRRPDGRVGRSLKKGFLEMFTSFASARETATVFAGAFLSALLLVSAATSVPLV
ncbi:MAG TPA: hypothetical protein VJ597_06645 [Sphingomicrobium sp.]|nr:hypothetical protein [Sphingomicrobium sp.]